MNIAFDTATEVAEISTATLTASHTVTGAAPIFWAYTNIRGGGTTISSITYGGVAMTQAATVSISGSTAYLHYLTNPPLGSNTFSVSHTIGFISANLSSYSSARQFGQPDASTTNTGSKPITTSVTSVASNCWFIYAGYNTVAAFTAGTNSTYRVGGTTAAGSLFDSNGPQPPGSFSMTVSWAGAAGNSGMIMASFAPNASGELGLLGVG